MLCYNKDVRRKKAISSLGYVKTSAATEFLYPFDVSCLLCGDEPGECSHGGFCENCRREIRENTGRICQKCGRALIAEERFCEICRERERKFDCARSCYVYEGGIRRAARKGASFEQFYRGGRGSANGQGRLRVGEGGAHCSNSRTATASGSASSLPYFGSPCR